MFIESQLGVHIIEIVDRYGHSEIEFCMYYRCFMVKCTYYTLGGELPHPTLALIQ